MNSDENQENRSLVLPATARSMLPKVTQYMVTIKLHKLDYVSKEELDTQLNKLVKRMKNTDWSSIVAYETDSLHRMHLHTSCSITGRPPYFKLLQQPGMSINFATRNQASGKKIIKYILKFDQSPQAIINRFMINEHYWTTIAIKRDAFKSTTLSVDS